MTIKKICLSIFVMAALWSCSKDDGPTNKAPVIAAQSFTVQESIADDTNIGNVKATDADGDALTFSISANSNNLFEIAKDGALSLASGKALDFGTATSHNITVGVSDGEDTASAKITVNVTSTNVAPVIGTIDFSVTEDALIVGNIDATDADGDALTYEITMNDNDLFVISQTGEISLAEGQNLDYETTTKHTLEVSVSDGEDTVSAEIQIGVENIIESMAEDPASFITTWNAEAGVQVLIPITLNNDPLNFTVDWGDGTVEDIKDVFFTISHTYDADGTYTVAIQGSLPSIWMGFDAGTPQYLASIEQWGSIQWETMLGAFKNCSNMVYNATDVPDLSNVTNLNSMFSGASSFNGAIGNWDVSNVTSLNGMFDGAQSFNQDISGWNTGNVENMHSMFNYATSFNGDISGWDTSKVTGMGSMFYGAESFDQDLNAWDTSKVTSMSLMFRGASSFNGDISTWDTSNVTDMSIMFRDAINFNQDISGWNTGNVKYIYSMFEGASSFDQNLGSWNIGGIAGIDTMSNMLDNSGMSPQNLNATLIGWHSFVQQNNDPVDITLGLQGLTACGTDSFQAAFALDVNYGWNIVGATFDEICN